MTRNKRALASLLLTAPLALTACEGSSHYTISEGGTGTLAMEMKISRVALEELDGEGSTCEDFEPVFTENEQVPDNVRTEDLGDAETFHCRFTLDTLTYRYNETLTGTEETFIFEIESSPEFQDNLFSLDSRGDDYTYVIEMPGDITSAPGAEIEGNVATYADPLSMYYGVRVEGYKTADSDGVSPLLIGGIALGAALVVGGVVLAARGKNNKPQPPLTNPGDNS